MAPTFFTTLDGDVILRAGEGSGPSYDFRVHRLVLSLSSSIFRDMFELASPTGQTIPVVEVADSPQAIDTILRFIYPGVERPEFNLEEFEVLAAVLATAVKYDMGWIVSTLRKSLKTFLPSGSVAVYLLASRFGFKEEVKEAARTTTIWMFTINGNEEQVNQVSSATLYRLIQFVNTRHVEWQSKVEDALHIPRESTGCGCSKRAETRQFYRSLVMPIARLVAQDPCFELEALLALGCGRDPPHTCEPMPHATEASLCPLMQMNIRHRLLELARGLEVTNDYLLREYFE